MTHRYQVSREGQGGGELLGTVSYTTLVPPGWQGFCCHCHRRLTVADWHAGEIAAAGNGSPWHCLCLSHVRAKGPEYDAAIDALARAVVGH